MARYRGMKYPREVIEMNEKARRYLALVEDAWRIKGTRQYRNKQETLALHDLHYHGGKFDPATMKCGLRETMAENDDVDLVASSYERVPFDEKSHSGVLAEVAQSLKAFREAAEECYRAEQSYWKTRLQFGHGTAKQLREVKVAARALHQARKSLRKTCLANGCSVKISSDEGKEQAEVSVRIPSEASWSEERPPKKDPHAGMVKIGARWYPEGTTEEELNQQKQERSQQREVAAQIKQDRAKDEWRQGYAAKVTEEVDGNKNLYDAIYGFMTDQDNGMHYTEAFQKYFGEYGFPTHLVKFRMTRYGARIVPRRERESKQDLAISIKNLRMVMGIDDPKVPSRKE